MKTPEQITALAEKRFPGSQRAYVDATSAIRHAFEEGYEAAQKQYKETVETFNNTIELKDLEVGDFSKKILSQEKQIKALKTEIKVIQARSWIDQNQKGEREPTEKDLPFVTFDGHHYEFWDDSDWFQELTEKDRLSRRFWKPIK